MRRIDATPKWVSLVEPMIEVIVGRSMSPRDRKARVNVRAEIYKVVRFLDSDKVSASGRYAYGIWTKRFREVMWFLRRGYKGERSFRDFASIKQYVREFLYPLMKYMDEVNLEAEKSEWRKAHGRNPMRSRRNIMEITETPGEKYSWGQGDPVKKAKVRGVLTYVGPDVFTIDNDKFRMVDPRYWSAGSSQRASRALYSLRAFVGKRVVADADYHRAFGWTVFGRRAIKLDPSATNPLTKKESANLARSAHFWGKAGIKAKKEGFDPQYHAGRSDGLSEAIAKYGPRRAYRVVRRLQKRAAKVWLPNRKKKRSTYGKEMSAKLRGLALALRHEHGKRRKGSRRNAPNLSTSRHAAATWKAGEAAHKFLSHMDGHNLGLFRDVSMWDFMMGNQKATTARKACSGTVADRYNQFIHVVNALWPLIQKKDISKIPLRIAAGSWGTMEQMRSDF